MRNRSTRLADAIARQPFPPNRLSTLVVAMIAFLLMNGFIIWILRLWVMLQALSRDFLSSVGIAQNVTDEADGLFLAGLELVAG